MAGQADDADVVCEVFAAELGAEADFLGGFFELFFEFDVTEGVSQFVALCGEVVVVFDGGFFDGFEVFLGGCSADDEGDVVWGTCGCAECLHFFDQEGEECLGVDQGLGFLVEVCLVGRAAAFGYEEEVVFVVVAGVDVDLGGEVAPGVDFVVHVQGCVLAVTEVVGGVSVVYTARYALDVIASGEYVLTFFAVYDGCAGVLAEGELAFGCDFGVAEHCQGDEFVVFAGFGVMEDFCDHGVVLAAEHEGVVMGGLTCQYGECFGVDDEEFVSAPVLGVYVFVCELVVLGGIGSQWEHGLILVGFGCHSVLYIGCFVVVS